MDIFLKIRIQRNKLDNNKNNNTCILVKYILLVYIICHKVVSSKHLINYCINQFISPKKFFFLFFSFTKLRDTTIHTLHNPPYDLKNDIYFIYVYLYTIFTHCLHFVFIYKLTPIHMRFFFFYEISYHIYIVGFCFYFVPL